MTSNEFDDMTTVEENSVDQGQPENLVQHNKRAAEVQEKLDARHEQSAGVIDGMTGTFHRIDTEKSKNEAVEKDPWYKRPFMRKIGYAFVALIVALTLWGYVLMKENPTRIKSVEDVKLNFEVGAEADLKSRGLVVNDDLNELLSEVTVNVRTTLNDLPRFNNSVSDIVTATISLSDIREPGTYTRNIVATSTIGTVESVEPKTVTITVESLRSKNIPITCEYIGELPDGYWHGEAQLSQTSISVTGPDSVISRIRSGVCEIDLTDLTDRLYSSLPIKLIGADKEVIDMSNIVDTVPSVIITMNVYPIRTFTAADFLNLVGTNDDLFEYTIVSSPSEIIIAAPADVLATITDFAFESIDVSGLVNGDYHKTIVTLSGLPSEAVLTNISGNRISVTVEVSDKIISKRFEYTFSSESDIVGRQPNTHYRIDAANPYIVTFTGPARYLNELTASDISFSVNVSNLNGYHSHSVKPQLTVAGDPDWLNDESVSVDFGQVAVTLTYELAN